jgi:LacI family transcriptional regulator
LEESDTVAALKFGLKNGYKIPKNSIIGFADGGLVSRRLTPTTVSQHAPEIGERAAQLLIDRLESNEEDVPYKTVVINTILKERESTRVKSSPVS